MSIEYKDIMDCERVDAIPENAYIPAVINGDLKLISKEDAKFGGGSVTTYVLSEPEIGQYSASSTSVVEFLTADGSVATPKEIYDAFCAGVVQVRSPLINTDNSQKVVQSDISEGETISTVVSIVTVVDTNKEIVGLVCSISVEHGAEVVYIDPYGYLNQGSDK